jgi:uncharacterized protein YbjT (DUF2867 family)
MELVTGATGYVGGKLSERLLGEGRRVRALARDPSRLAPREGLEAVRGDLLSGDRLAAALEGCATAYYLVHSMEARPAGEAAVGNGGFAGNDRRAAENFAAAARAAGDDVALALHPGEGHFGHLDPGNPLWRSVTSWIR